MKLEAYLRFLAKTEDDTPEALYKRYTEWLSFSQSTVALFDAAHDLGYDSDSSWEAGTNSGTSTY